MKEIQLTQGKVALVDDEDFEYLNQWNWWADCRYAAAIINKKKIMLHTIIMKTPTGFEIDHIDNNGLNNQKSNLRICTRQQNAQNQPAFVGCASKYKGVSFVKHGKHWMTRITVDGLLLYLGSFDDEHLAALIYNAAAIKYFGDFACINKLPPEYEKLFEKINTILKENK